MYATFAPFPDWANASPLELLVWLAAMSLGAALTIFFLAAILRENANPQAHQFRCVFLMLVCITLAFAGMRYAARTHAAADAAPLADPSGCPPVERKQIWPAP
jgi:hypothetical protein